MTLLTTHPVLDSRTAINYYIENDTDLGAEFSYTDSRTKETAYRIYSTPLSSNVIKGTSFSTYFMGEAPYNPEYQKRIPILYSDIAVQHAVLETAIDTAWLLATSVEETLRDYPSLHLNNRATCGHHRITDIIPVETDGGSLWTFILTITHEVFPLGTQL